jgi:transcription antitermination factor NusG
VVNKDTEGFVPLTPEENEARRARLAETWWYGLQVRSSWEAAVAEEIEKLSAVSDAFVPKFKALVVKKRQSRFKKACPEPEEVEKPLFAGWLFVRFSSGLYKPFGNVMNAHRKIDGFLSVGGEPIPIQGFEIEKLRRECDAGVYNGVGIEGAIEVGDRVEIKYNGKDTSPFDGHRGEFVALDDQTATIEISIFGRATLVKVPAGMIKKLFGAEITTKLKKKGK